MPPKSLPHLYAMQVFSVFIHEVSSRIPCKKAASELYSYFIDEWWLKRKWYQPKISMGTETPVGIYSLRCCLRKTNCLNEHEFDNDCIIAFLTSLWKYFVLTFIWQLMLNWSDITVNWSQPYCTCLYVYLEFFKESFGT